MKATRLAAVFLIKYKLCYSQSAGILSKLQHQGSIIMPNMCTCPWFSELWPDYRR